jgi:hypothetical protein
VKWVNSDLKWEMAAAFHNGDVTFSAAAWEAGICSGQKVEVLEGYYCLPLEIKSYRTHSGIEN